MKRILLILTGILIIQISVGQNHPGSNFMVLDMAEAFSRKEEVKLSRFVNDISYIKLEATSESLIAGYSQYEVTNDFIIVRQGQSRVYQILLFDRYTGKFLHQIGKAGRGPGEFFIYSIMPYNPVKKEIYGIDNSSNILIYNLNGINTGRIITPKLIDKQPGAFASIIDNDTFVMQVINSTDNEKRKLILLSADGKTKIFPNKLTWDTTRIKGHSSPPAWGYGNFYIWDNKTNFVELYCDTLYQVTKEAMIPRYFFNWGKYNSPYSEQLWMSDHNRFFRNFTIKLIFENKSNIFVQACFNENDQLFFVEKATGKVTFCKTSESDVPGFQDDINGLMTVIPQGFTPQNEMVWIIQPVALLKWLKQNPAAADKAYKKLNWLKDIDEMSNPVIAIAKCKN